MRSPSRILPVVVALLGGAGALSFLLWGGAPAPSPEAPPAEARSPEVAAPQAPRIAEPDPVGEPGPGDPGTGGSRPRAGARGTVPTRVTGVVQDEEGRPIAGAAVALHPVDPQALRGAPIPDGPARVTGTTDRAGEFALDAPPRGWLRIVATAPGHATGGALAAGAGVHVVVRLGPAGSLEIRVVDPEGSPVAGAVVEAATGEAAVRGVTSAGGVCLLESLAPGSATLTASADGFAAARAAGVVVTPGARNRAVLALGRLVLLEGRVLDAGTGEPVDAAEVHVARPGHAVPAGLSAADGSFGPVAAGAPGDRVFVAVRAEGYGPALAPVILGSPGLEAQRMEVRIGRSAPWSGRVEDGQGNGVQGAVVSTTSDGVAGRAPPSATTDADGRFTLPPPPPPAPGRRIVLTASRGETRAALALHPDDPRPDPLVLVLSAGAGVTGRILDATGRPQAGVQVRLVPVWGDREARRRPDATTSRLLALNEGGLVDLMASSDEAGWWEVSGVPDGEYQLRVEADAAPRWVHDPIRVAGASVDAGTLTLGKGLTLEGRVVGADGRPLAGARVHATSTGTPPRAVSTTTRSDGGFAFLDLAPGTFGLAASYPGFEEARMNVELAGSREVELELVAAPRLLLEVRDAGTPYEGTATVSLARADRPSARDQVRVLEARQGRIEVTDAPSGAWSVTVEAAGGRIGRAAAPVEVAAGEAATVAVDLAPAAVLEGRVRAADGGPAAGAAVFLGRDRALRRSATTDPEGRYRIPALAAGDYEVRVVHPGGAPMVQQVVLTTGERRTLDVALADGGSLEVSVVDEGGRPRRDVVLRVGFGLLPPDAPPWRTGADGRVTVPHLPSGQVLLQARGPDGAVAEARALVVEGETRAVELILAPRQR